MLDTQLTQIEDHQILNEAFDTALVKARRPTCIGNRHCSAADEEFSTPASMPAPKVWRRPARKLVPSSSVIPAEISTRAGIINAMDPIDITTESAPIELDGWSRDFLFLVELND